MSNPQSDRSQCLSLAKKIKRGELVVKTGPELDWQFSINSRNRSFRSNVWTLFGRIFTKEGDFIEGFVYCMTCEVVKKCANSSTSGLIKHKCYRNIRYPKVETVDCGSQTIEDFEFASSKIEKVKSNPFSKKNLIKMITKWMIGECQSYDLLQSESFKSVLYELAVIGSTFGGDINVAQMLPTLPEARNNLSKTYDSCFERIMAEIALIKENGFSLTCTIRKDDLTKQSYMAVTIHYVGNGVLKNRLLGLRLLEHEEKCTNRIPSKEVQQILQDYGCELSNKSIMVLDFSSNTVSETPKNAHVLPCISHLLSEALLKSIQKVPEVLEIINACSKLINFLIKSQPETVLNDYLNKSQHNAFLKIYKMLNFIEDKWIEIEEILKKLNEKAIILTIHLNHLRAVVKALQPFEEAFETLEDDSAPTLQLVFIYLYELKKSCDKTESEFLDFDFIEHLKENLRLYIEKIMKDDLKTLHKIALFLYPPTNKLTQFDDTEKEFIESECQRLMKNYKQENIAIVSKPATTPSPAVKRRKLFSDFLASERNQNSCAVFSQEIESYKKFPTIYTDDFDVFNWWQLHKNNFPLLYKLSCVVLATPATCAAAKKVLSAGNNNLFRDKAIQLIKEIDVERIMFVNSNNNLSDTQKDVS